jgi:plasmid maintenance system antidote protein VapI
MTDLTPGEQSNVRTALRYFRREYGGWKSIAKMLGFELDSVSKVNLGGRNVSGSMAIRVARIAGVPVEALLAGKYPPPGTCEKCGYRASSVIPRPRPRQNSKSDLLPQEGANVCTALLFLRGKSGNWQAVADGIGYECSSVMTMSRGERAITGSMAMRTARFAGVSVDDLLAGKYPPPGTCPKCGYLPDLERVAKDATRHELARKQKT